MPQNNSHKNKEGYSDPTVYEALRKIDEEDAHFHRLLDIISASWQASESKAVLC